MSLATPAYHAAAYTRRMKAASKFDGKAPDLMLAAWFAADDCLERCLYAAVAAASA